MSASLSATVTGGKLPKSPSAAKTPQVGWNDVHVRPFSWNDIDRVEITVVCGVERGPKTGTQAHLHLLASGLTVCETFPFGKSESTPLKQVLLEIPPDALNRERFPQISVFLILFAQRNDSTEGVLFSVDTIDFALRKK